MDLKTRLKLLPNFLTQNNLKIFKKKKQLRIIKLFTKKNCCINFTTHTILWTQKIKQYIIIKGKKNNLFFFYNELMNKNLRKIKKKKNH